MDCSNLVTSDLILQIKFSAIKFNQIKFWNKRFSYYIKCSLLKFCNNFKHFLVSPL